MGKLNFRNRQCIIISWLDPKHWFRFSIGAASASVLLRTKVKNNKEVEDTDDEDQDHSDATVLRLGNRYEQLGPLGYENIDLDIFPLLKEPLPF